MRRQAFTLVELSIVLVILGLLVGGVLAGQSLIHAAELRAVSTELTQHKTAVNTFRDKYFALPGDMPNAVRYWGTAVSGGSTADGIDADCAALNESTTPANATVTCNGNGDGMVGIAGGQLHEAYRYWQHLANAGLIEGSYAGHTIDSSSARGRNVPKSRFSNAGWFIFARPGTPTATISGMLLPQQTNLFLLGREGTSSAGTIMKPEDLYNIDMKLDDGKPHTGSIRSLGRWDSDNDADENCPVSGNQSYNLSSQNNRACALGAIAGF